MPGDSGLTTYDGRKIVVQIPRRVRHNAFMGDGYARFTIAHELGHAALHPDKLMQGAALPRRVAGNGVLGGFRNSSRQSTRRIFSARRS
jgi:IrrE N-terminal-like domain